MRGVSLILITLIPFFIKGYFEKDEKRGCLFLNRCSNPPFFIFSERCSFKETKIYDLSEIRCEGEKIIMRKIGGKEGLFFGNKIDLNEAELDDLVAIPGIGYNLAEKIIDLREKKGGFKSLEELIEIRGIGKKKVKELGNFLFLNLEK